MGRWARVKVLLDTHAFLWAVMEPRKLSATARALLENPETGITVSAASAWEIATKFRIGRLPGAANVMADYAAAVSGLAAQTLPISDAHALMAGSFKQAHRDPFDRMLAAQATLEGLPLVSCDPLLKAFGVELVW